MRTHIVVPSRSTPPSDQTLPMDRELTGITREDARLVADVVGDRPPILFFHGHGFTRASWFGVFGELGRRYVVVTP